MLFEKVLVILKGYFIVKNVNQRNFELGRIGLVLYFISVSYWFFLRGLSVIFFLVFLGFSYFVEVIFLKFKNDYEFFIFVFVIFGELFFIDW